MSSDVVMDDIGRRRPVCECGIILVLISLAYTCLSWFHIRQLLTPASSQCTGFVRRVFTATVSKHWSTLSNAAHRSLYGRVSLSAEKSQIS